MNCFKTILFFTGEQKSKSHSTKSFKRSKKRCHLPATILTLWLMHCNVVWLQYKPNPILPTKQRFLLSLPHLNFIINRSRKKLLLLHGLARNLISLFLASHLKSKLIINHWFRYYLQTIWQTFLRESSDLRWG